MSEGHTTGGDRPEAGLYEIRLAGHLDARWSARLDGLSIAHGVDGTTLIHGSIADQAALHGLLQRVRDLGIPLLSVTRGAAGPPLTPGSDLAAATTAAKSGALTSTADTTRSQR